jgi:hypothetical protein
MRNLANAPPLAKKGAVLDNTDACEEPTSLAASLGTQIGAYRWRIWGLFVLWLGH